MKLPTIPLQTIEAPDAELLPSFDEIDKLIAEKSLEDFSRQAWHILEPTNPFSPGWHISAICEHLEAVSNKQIRSLLINMPPRHMKSLLVAVFWPVWNWIKRPEERSIFASYAATLSTRDSLKCRRLIESSWFQQRWGNIVTLRTDQNQKMRFENTRSGYRISTSVDGSATGEGGDYVVADDPHNMREKDSNIKLESVLEWWDNTMSTRLNDTRTGCKIIVMQRVAQGDLSGHVLKKEGYEHLCLPAEYDPARRCVTSLGWSDPRSTEGELLWPKRVGLQEINKLKNELGPVGFAGQYNQVPVPKGGARFKSDWIRRYTHSNPAARNAPLRIEDYIGEYHLSMKQGGLYNISVGSCRRFAICDPAGTDKEQNSRACYTAVGVFAETPRKDLVMLHMQRAQVDIPSGVQMIASICRRFKVSWIGIEKNGLGLGVVNKVKELGIAVKGIVAEGPKEARSELAEIRMQGGQIFLPYEAEWLKDFEEELLFFPRGQYQDQVDVLSHAAIQVAYKTLNLTPVSLPSAV